MDLYAFSTSNDKDIDVEQNIEEINKLELIKLKSTATTGIQVGTKLKQFIKNEYEQLVNKEESHINIAKKLGIYFEKKIQISGLEEVASKLDINIR